MEIENDDRENGGKILNYVKTVHWFPWNLIQTSEMGKKTEEVEENGEEEINWMWSKHQTVWNADDNLHFHNSPFKASKCKTFNCRFLCDIFFFHSSPRLEIDRMACHWLSHVISFTVLPCLLLLVMHHHIILTTSFFRHRHRHHTRQSVQFFAFYLQFLVSFNLVSIFFLCLFFHIGFQST